MWYTLLIGFIVGLGVALASSRVVMRRSVARARAAERRARSAERLAELGSMTSGLAHEIKNPLSTIGLNAQLLAEGIDDLETVDEQHRGRLTRRVEALGRESERLRGILEDFLEYAGELRIHAQRGDLNTVVEEIVDFLDPQASASGVHLRAQPAPDPVIASFDAAHIKQAVLNLVLNALQVLGSHDGPREVFLRTETATADDGSPVARLHVIDTGPGIDAEQQQRIFRPYFTTRSGGTGLGLPTARRIIETHTGRLTLHSEPGRGSDFTIELPGVAE